MLKPFAHLIVNILVLLVLSTILPRFKIDITSAFFLTITLTLLNWTVVPIIKILTWPINLLSLGFLYFFINLCTIFLATSLVRVELGSNFAEKVLTAILVIFGLSLVNGWANNLSKE